MTEYTLPLGSYAKAVDQVYRDRLHSQERKRVPISATKTLLSTETQHVSVIDSKQQQQSTEPDSGLKTLYG